MGRKASTDDGFRVAQLGPPDPRLLAKHLVNTMNSKMMAAGIALVFVAMALPSNASHIVTSATSDNSTWTANGGLLTLCETNSAGSLPARGGIGGLCYISAGFSMQDTDSDAATPDVCAFAGKSNGKFYAYNNLACVTATGLSAPPRAVIPSANVERNWFQVQLPGAQPVGAIPDPPAAPPVPGPTELQKFSAEIDIFFCPAGTTFVYDEQFAYTMSSGHVTAFVDASVPAGTTGTYTITQVGAASGTACDSGFPMYYAP